LLETSLFIRSDRVKEFCMHALRIFSTSFKTTDRRVRNFGCII